MASSDIDLCNVGFFSLGSELRKQLLSQLAALSCGNNAQPVADRSGSNSAFSTAKSYPIVIPCYPIVIPLTSTAV